MLKRLGATAKAPSREAASKGLVSKTFALVAGGVLLTTGAVFGGSLLRRPADKAEATQAAAPGPKLAPLSAEPLQEELPVAPSMEANPEPVPKRDSVRTSSRPARPATPTRQNRTPASTLEDERKLLDRARTALMAQAWSDALEIVGLHQMQFPQGALAEEREALTIQALSVVDPPAARRRAAAFRQRWPSSLLEPVIESVVPRDGTSSSLQ